MEENMLRIALRWSDGLRSLELVALLWSGWKESSKNSIICLNWVSSGHQQSPGPPRCTWSHRKWVAGLGGGVVIIVPLTKSLYQTGTRFLTSRILPGCFTERLCSPKSTWPWLSPNTCWTEGRTEGCYHHLIWHVWKPSYVIWSPKCCPDVSTVNGPSVARTVILFLCTLTTS